ncbi:MAG TPA: LPS assembly lipoprotein LptE [Noviherbaspirillum sp.]|jgi:LPS-assembly lipoprotein|uniref:LPS-assembly lipoprotein LptE n=1 Tax=Noviherbaspirillum sp. TaxID=1926288 RepID=UPI002F94ACAD
MKRRRFLLSFSALTLSACGFQLRGTGGRGVLPFKSVHLGAGTTGSLGVELRRYIRANDVELAPDPKSAEVTLEILSERRDRATLSLNSQGRVRDYSIYYTVRFRMIDAKGAEVLAPADMTLKRDITFNESQVIAKEKEEEMLYRDMQSDVVQQILRRMAALKPA